MIALTCKKHQQTLAHLFHSTAHLHSSHSSSLLSLRKLKGPLVTDTTYKPQEIPRMKLQPKTFTWKWCWRNNSWLQHLPYIGWKVLAQAAVQSVHRGGGRHLLLARSLTEQVASQKSLEFWRHQRSPPTCRAQTACKEDSAFRDSLPKLPFFSL